MVFRTTEQKRISADVSYVCKRLADYYDDDQQLVWLSSYQKLLEDRKPIDLIEAGKTAEVLQVIQMMDDCVYI